MTAVRVYLIRPHPGVSANNTRSHGYSAVPWLFGSHFCFSKLFGEGSERAWVGVVSAWVKFCFQRRSEVTLSREGGPQGVPPSSPKKGEAQSSHVTSSWRERVFFEKARGQPSPCVILVLPHRW